LLDPSRVIGPNDHQTGKGPQTLLQEWDRRKNSVALSCASPRFTPGGHRDDRAEHRGGKWLRRKRLARPARLERATSWFVAVNTFVDPTQLTNRELVFRIATWTQFWTHFPSPKANAGRLPTRHLPWAKNRRFQQLYPGCSTSILFNKLGNRFRSKTFLNGHN
jgi:hypothetical protein